MVICFDIDGTLADIEKRLLKAGDAPKKKNKKEFQAWLNKLQKKKDLLEDEPIKGMPEIARCFANSFTVVYVTGRAEKYREVTVMWLFKNLFPSGELYMRPDENMQDTDEYKQEQMLEVVKKYGNDIVVFDDDPEDNCGPMYKKQGWTHMKAMANYGD